MVDLSHVATEALAAELERREPLALKKGRRRWQCRTCGVIFHAGESGHILFADHGRFWCYACTEAFRRAHEGFGWAAIMITVNQIYQGYGEMLEIIPLTPVSGVRAVDGTPLDERTRTCD